MKGLNIGKIVKDGNYIVVSSKEALKDVAPMEWPEEVVNGQKKVIITSSEPIKEQYPLHIVISTISTAKLKGDFNQKQTYEFHTTIDPEM